MGDGVGLAVVVVAAVVVLAAVDEEVVELAVVVFAVVVVATGLIVVVADLEQPTLVAIKLAIDTMITKIIARFPIDASLIYLNTVMLRSMAIKSPVAVYVMMRLALE